MKKFLFYIVLFVGFNLSIAENNIPTNGEEEEVKVSWYGKKFHGKLTASGQIYDMNDFTAAHKTLPFGTQVEITNTRNGKSVIVTINDRGPFHGNRKFDLSKAAFHEIAQDGRGIITATYRIVN